MPDREKVVKAIDICLGHGVCNDCPYCLSGKGYTTMNCRDYMMRDALAMLKEQEVPQELKYKMWNTFYAEEDKFEKMFVGTDEHGAWFNTYRPWFQKGFDIAIRVIADWEGR